MLRVHVFSFFTMKTPCALAALVPLGILIMKNETCSPTINQHLLSTCIKRLENTHLKHYITKSFHHIAYTTDAVISNVINITHV